MEMVRLLAGPGVQFRVGFSWLGPVGGLAPHRGLAPPDAESRLGVWISGPGGGRSQREVRLGESASAWGLGSLEGSNQVRFESSSLGLEVYTPSQGRPPAGLTGS